MIASVRGEVLDIALDHAVIEASGVGYRVNATPVTLGALHRGSEARLFTTMIVREDSMTLYGFSDTESKDLFSLFANGLGCRAAPGDGNSRSSRTRRIAAGTFGRQPDGVDESPRYRKTRR